MVYRNTFDNIMKKHKEFKQKKEKWYNKHKKDERHKKYDAKEKNKNDAPQTNETNDEMNPDIAIINQKNNNHNKKKEYSAWSAAKINVNVKHEKDERESSFIREEKIERQYDSGYDDDDSEEDDDNDDDHIYLDSKKPSHNKTSTPSWMFERAKNREDVRKEEHKSDWIFARANDRKKFHDLNAAEWHSRKSKNKVCNEDSEGDESCENIEKVRILRQ